MVFIFDLDGTICFNGKQISTNIVERLKNLQKQGDRLIIASARPIRDIYPVLPGSLHELEMVGGNGAFIKIGNTIDTISIECIDELKEIIGKYHLDYLVDGVWDYAYSGQDDHPFLKNVDSNRLARNVNSITKLDNIVKLVLFTDCEDVIKELLQLPVEIHIHTNENIIDISPLHIDKWTGLQKLGVAKEQFIAFGNDINDVKMFKNAKESICVGSNPLALRHATKWISANDLIKELDSYITLIGSMK